MPNLIKLKESDEDVKSKNKISSALGLVKKVQHRKKEAISRHWPGILLLGGVHNLCWKLPIIDHRPSPCWHLWTNSFTNQGKICILLIFPVCTTYLPRLVNIIVNSPLGFFSILSRAYVPVRRSSVILLWYRVLALKAERMPDKLSRAFTIVCVHY